MWSALILTSWTCVLLASASASQVPPKGPSQGLPVSPTQQYPQPHAVPGQQQQPAKPVTTPTNLPNTGQIPPNQAPSNDKDAYEYSKFWWNRANAIAAFVLAGLTFILAAIYGIIACLMNRGNQQSRRIALATISASRASRRAARAAERSAKIASDDMERSHRAYVTIDNTDFTYLGADATLTIRKSGVVPATRINFTYFRGIFQGRIKVTDQSFNLQMHPPFLGGVISHNDPITFRQPISTEAFPEAERADTGKEFIYIGFMIGYFDGFRARHTWQVWEYKPETRTFALYASDQD